jgi:putative phage-type endonuclease
MGFLVLRDTNSNMETALRTWLLDNRPYTRLSTRIKHFTILCKKLEPEISYTTLKKKVKVLVDKLMNEDVGSLWIRDRCFERTIRLYGINDQRTSAWHTKRGEMITASEVYNLFTTPAARLEVMMRKLTPQSGSGNNTAPALLWGTRFEPIAKAIYEEKTNCKIIDVSCATHPVYSFLGASPDGLIVPNDSTDIKRYGRLVEFKCPISRPETDGIPPAYQMQMQMQMACTGIDECEYVEFRFKQVYYSEWEKSTNKKGFFTVSPTGDVIYDAYQENEDAQTIYWILMSIKEDFMHKDPEWIPTKINILTDFWNEVLTHRKNGTTPASAKVSVFSLDI